MTWIALAAVTAIILFVVCGITKQNGRTTWKKNPKQWAARASIALVGFGCIASVPTGHTGILTTFGKVEDVTLEAGLHFKLPVQEVVCIDNRTQKSQLNLTAFSSDIQEVTVAYSINYQVVMEPRIQVAVKSVIARYTAESLVEKRDQLSSEITEILRGEMNSYSIEVVNTAIENLDFSDAFTDAVEAKQVAQQNLLKAQTEQNQKTMEANEAAERQRIAAEAEAKVSVIAAEADKEVLQIQADAAEYAGQKDAAVNKALAETLTDELLRYYLIKQWNGILPSYLVTGADTVLPILGSAETGKTPAGNTAPAGKTGAD